MGDTKGERINILSQEQYNHIKEKGFNPRICSECQEIDAILVNLVANAHLIAPAPDLYGGLKAWAEAHRVAGGIVPWNVQEVLAEVEKEIEKQ